MAGGRAPWKLWDGLASGTGAIVSGGKGKGGKGAEGKAGCDGLALRDRGGEMDEAVGEGAWGEGGGEGV